MCKVSAAGATSKRRTGLCRSSQDCAWPLSRAGGFCAAARRSGRLGDVMQDQQLFPRAGSDGVGATLIVAELHEQGLVVQLLNDRADLAAASRGAGRSVSNATTSKRDGLSVFAPFSACIIAPKTGRTSACSRRFVRSRSLLSQRFSFVARLSRRGANSSPRRPPQPGRPRRSVLLRAKHHAATRLATLKIEDVTEYPSLMPPARMRWVQAVVLDLADIEDSLFAERQALCHCARLGSHRV
jgi:hypothetical protein